MEDFNMKPLFKDINETIEFHFKKMLRNHMDDYSDLKKYGRIIQSLWCIKDANDKLQKK